jgi:hypothetical protein
MLPIQLFFHFSRVHHQLVDLLVSNRLESRMLVAHSDDGLLGSFNVFLSLEDLFVFHLNHQAKNIVLTFRIRSRFATCK